MFAEAENELKGAPAPGAISALEEVRKRAFAGNESKIGATPTDKVGFFNAIVPERNLEFGDEGIRKYFLIGWNLLKIELNAARQNLANLMNGVGADAGLPKVIYWKNNGEEIQSVTSFYKTEPATALAGSKSVGWVKSIVATNIDDPVNRSAFAQYFTPNKSELMPFDQDRLF
jgi:starch-binding outer membrane protein, SusD/RagB family